MGRLQLVERARGLLVLLALTVLTAACSTGNAEPRVFAAASLRDAFTAIGGAELVFDGSAALLRQLRDGARADVLATADRESMEVSGLPGAVVFARNRLAIAVARGNPRGVRGLADLSRVRVALAGPSVPAGRYARQAFANARLAVPRASEEQSVRAVVAKVALGEADAGIVYVTDLTAGVEGFPVAPEVSVAYLAAPVTDRGRDFVASLLSERGRAVLAAHGFLPP